ncbi:hypothetical protein Y1Q_0018916 [Alligator mississippiensis]|uniref:Uncharacterized protein n=1 Tax=Alligator mississippiensis TaxID=8496 RepID=A0A151M382_ALLMI|nr:hypothetical protein Y1Q_0018916 [Alligator mississippiensis]
MILFLSRTVTHKASTPIVSKLSVTHTVEVMNQMRALTREKSTFWVDPSLPIMNLEEIQLKSVMAKTKKE